MAVELSMFRFDPMKAIQAAALLMKQHGGQMSRLRLLKLLYIADRESLAETLHPITGDHAAALDHGPVPSQTYDLLKHQGKFAELWDQHIIQFGPRNHRLVKDPGEAKLS